MTGGARLAVLALLAVAPVVPAANGPSPHAREASPPLFRETARYLGSKLGDLASRETLLWTVAGASLTVLAHQVEDPDGTADFLEKNPLENAFDAGNYYGHALFATGATAAVWITGRAAGKPHIEETAIDLGTSFLIAGSVTAALKFSIDRTRPNGDSYSFPSGHAAMAFTAAPVLQRRYGLGAGIPAYAMAFVTAAARMEDRKHYLSDVVAGAAIGMVAGKLAVPVEEERRPALFIDGEGAGVRMTF